MVDVDKLGVLQGEAGTEDIHQGVGGVQGGHAGYAQDHSLAVEHGVVAHGIVLDGAGIDDVVHGTVFHEPEDLVTDLRSISYEYDTGDICFYHGNDLLLFLLPRSQDMRSVSDAFGGQSGRVDAV